MALNALRFALAAGIVVGVMGAAVTVMALLGVPGFPPFANALAQGYGPWGSSGSWPGVAVGLL